MPNTHKLYNPRVRNKKWARSSFVAVGHGDVESDDQIQSVKLSRYTTLIPVTTQFRKSLNHQRGFHCKNKCLNTSPNAWGFPKCQLVCVLHVWKECCYIRQTVWNWWFSCFEIWLCCLRVKNVHNWLWMNHVFYCRQHKFQTLAK